MRRHYSTWIKNENQNAQLDPWFITGYPDGERCFHISITKNKKLNLGWSVQYIFTIVSHVQDQVLLESIQKHLGVGGGENL